jgi:hypothetical protein
MSQPLIPRFPEQARAMRSALGKLRDYAGAHEYGLSGPMEIAAYLNEVVGLRTGRGCLITVATVRTFVKSRGLPVIVIRKADGMKTTNLMLLAWCWSYATYKKEKRCLKPRQ